MIQILSNNPFRVLGVYANSTMREIVANKGKMSAFLKVCKQVSFSLDLSAQLGAINRTPEVVAAADSQLTIDNDKLLAAQFWFFNSNQFDSVASNHLSTGDIDAAISIWEKKECMSSLQNRAVCYLVKNDIRNASSCLSKLYENYKTEFLSTIGIKKEIPIENLVENYVSEIIESIPDIDFALLSNAECSTLWNNAAKGKIVQPLIKKLVDAITVAKQSKGKTPQDRLEAGRDLNRKAKLLLFKLRRLLPNDDLQLVNISDKIGNEILQCGIDYYNESDSPFVAYAALDLQKAANMIVMGSMAKNRCKENGETLSEVLASLPPKEVEAEAIEIQSALKKFCELPDEINHAITLVDEVQAPLSKMKQKLGVTNDYYIKRSSVVIMNVLHNLIEEVNATQRAYNDAPAGSYTETSARNKYKVSVESAWSLTQRLGDFDMDAETRKRFNENRDILHRLYDQVHSNTTVVSSGSPSSNDNTWSSCVIQALVYLGIFILLRTCL